MANIVPPLNALLAGLNSPQIDTKPRPFSQLDEFLKEAYRIYSHILSLHAYLRSIRPAYLSTSAPPRRTHNSPLNPARVQQGVERRYLTDQERTAIDDESKSVVRGLSASIQNLQRAERMRQDTERALARKRRNPYGALGSWASGGLPGEGITKSPEEIEDEAKADGLKVHRDSVLEYVGGKLQDCNKLLMEMIETRIQRDLEKNKSVLYKMKGAAGIAAARPQDGGINGLVNGVSAMDLDHDGAPTRPSKSSYIEEDERKAIEAQLSPEQLQLFEQENQDMLKYYENTLDQVRQAESSLIEISDMQATLAANLSTQSAQIDQLVHDSFQTEENVGGGNKELKKAAERTRPAKYLFYGSIGFTVLVVIWDLII